MTEKECKDKLVFLPNELRIHFYLYFPEHGLNMANYSHELAFYKWLAESKLERYESYL